jgi:teichuronic acid biosynthesis glycosyltransferase TuaG
VSNAGNPEVSIITPLYNSEAYIEDTIQSVLKQTYMNFEWLIVDDHSTDASLDILKKYTATDKRIILLSQEKNNGPAHARNFAMDQAKGRYIAFLDSDDLWLPEKLEKQIALMKKNNAPLSYTAYKKINDKGKIKSHILINVPAVLTYNRLLGSNCIMASSAVFDSHITGPVRQCCHIPLGKDDYHFFLSILKKHNRAYGIKEDLARLRVHEGSITQDKFKAIGLQWVFYRRYLGLSFFSTLHRFIIYAVKGFLKYIR